MKHARRSPAYVFGIWSITVGGFAVAFALSRWAE